MATTILPKKAGQDNAIATDDDHHQALANDPAVQQFPQGSSFGSITNGFGTTSTAAFGSASATGFGAQSNFGATPNTSFGGQGAMPQQPQQPQPNLTAAGDNAATGADVLVKHSKESEDWINKKWRPVMGWMYMVVCVCDFTVFPILWSLLQALSHGQVNTQWQPVTLMGAGLFHVAMGAVLGIAAYGRTKEKLESKN